jgi:2-dehydro-3-deoxy-D-gluconate 5-dehydrogenase
MATEVACNNSPDIPSLGLFSLSGKTALVSGGTRGIGAACAIALAQAGAAICLIQRDLSNTATRDLIRNLPSPAPGRCDIIEADLSNPEATRHVFPQALEVVGGEIHILVNCAGIQRRAPAVEFSDQDWADVCFKASVL